jgi:hypothetical protein
MEEVVYTSKSELKNPLKLIRNMFSDLFSSRDLAMSLLMLLRMPHKEKSRAIT